MKKYKMQEEIGSDKTPVLSLGLDASADSAECVKGVKLQVTDLWLVVKITVVCL